MLTLPTNRSVNYSTRRHPPFLLLATMTHPLFTKHEATLDQALAAIETRGYWSPFAEMPSPKVYGETAAADGEAAFKAHLGKTFELDQPSTGETVGDERSPFGIGLGIKYPKSDPDALIRAAS